MRIRMLTEAQLAEAAAFCWRLCRVNGTRSYPLFADENAMTAEYRWSLTHPGGFLAGCDQGVVCGFTEAKSRYLQTTGFYVPGQNQAATRALADWLTDTFPGYTAHIGLPAENTTVADVLTGQGYRVLDDSLDLRLQTGAFRPAAVDGAARRIDIDTLPDYLPYHAQHFGDCYWNADRLRESFPQWDVYARRTDGRITGGLFLRHTPPDKAEIYGLHTDTEDGNLPLLHFALTEFLSRRPRTASVIYMTDAADTASANAALALGFRQVNHYRCYTKAL